MASVFVTKGETATVWARSDGSILHCTFGVIADAHYGYDPIASYPKRVATAVSEINAAGANFTMLTEVAHLDANGWREADADRLMAKFTADIASLKGDRRHVMANHYHIPGYTAAQDIAWWKRATGTPATYYAFDSGGIHFIVIMDDINHPADAAELAWIEAELARSRNPTIVLSPDTLMPMQARYPDWPVPFSLPSPNSAAILRLIEASGKVPAVISGGYHVGAQQKKAGIWHYAVRSLWDDSDASIKYPKWNNPTPDHFRAIVKVYNDKVVVDERPPELAESRWGNATYRFRKSTY